MSSSASIISNISRNTTSPTSFIYSSSHEQNNDERIQSIFDDINHIVENYTRELDDTLCRQTTTTTSYPLSLYRNDEHEKLSPPTLPPKRQIGNFLYINKTQHRKCKEISNNSMKSGNGRSFDIYA